MNKWKVFLIEEETLYELQKKINEFGKNGWEPISFSINKDDRPNAAFLRSPSGAFGPPKLYIGMVKKKIDDF